jgi:hypothetical protein
VLLFSSFNAIETYLGDENRDVYFNCVDNYTLTYKFLKRFGASTLSIVIASAICHPLDTLKRRVQMNGALQFNSTPSSIGGIRAITDVQIAAHMWNKEGGLKAFYKGFTFCMVKNIPLALV